MGYSNVFIIGITSNTDSAGEGENTSKEKENSPQE
jgi:hypothetical protein